MHQGNDHVWHHGSVEQAFDEARRGSKLVFLYWGAVWCPPCNEVKSQVFAHPEFADALNRFVAVKLDGDSEKAQMWADTLNVSGYPTLLVLTPDRREILRIVESVSFPEFKEALSLALLSARPFNETLAKVLGGKGSEADWKTLAYFSWDDRVPFASTETGAIVVKKRLADEVPVHLVREKAIFSARLLQSLAEQNAPGKDEKFQNTVLDVRTNALPYLDAMFASESAMLAARPVILYSTKSIVPWIYPEVNDQRRQKLITRWMNAADVIRESEESSIDTRLWAINPQLDRHTIQNPEDPAFPKALISQVQDAVEDADDEAQTEQERQAVISGAAELLRMVGLVTEARAMLQKEITKSASPWYYHSSLAALEEKAGNKAGALEQSTKARESARGRASVVQWTTSDLLMKAKLADEMRIPTGDIAAVAREYYEKTFALADGFSGRNLARAERVAKELKRWNGKPEFIGIFSEYSKKCGQFNVESDRKQCQQHFAQLLPAHKRQLQNNAQKNKT